MSELRAIEAALARHPDVADVVVAARSSGADERPWAWVVPRDAARGGTPHRLPSGLMVFHLNQNETDHLYHQIFDDLIYLRHGIAVPDEACILDIGANIGLFTLFAHTCCERPRIIAFEPSPPAFERLRRNAEHYGLAIEAEPCAVSDREGAAAFTIYPRASVMSGLFADPAEEERLFRTFAAEQLRGEADPELIADVVDEMAEGRFAVEVVERPLCTVSSALRERGIARVDLLKVDAEKSELGVFAGIAAEDWAGILQVTVEVHSDGWVAEVVALLEQQGFTVFAEQDSTMHATGIHHVYARRPRPTDGRIWHDRPWRTLQAAAAPRRAPTGAEPLCDSLRELLRRNLPGAQMPAGFTFLERLPRLGDGKVDRAALS